MRSAIDQARDATAGAEETEGVVAEVERVAVEGGNDYDNSSAPGW
jgi:hypothetical protein